MIMKKIKNFINMHFFLISIVIGMLVALCLKLEFSKDNNSIGFWCKPNNMMYILISVGICVLFYYNLKIKDKRLWITSMIVGILFSVLYYFGDLQNLYIYECIPTSKKFILYSFIKLITYTILFMNCILMLFAKVPNIIQKFNTEKELKFFTNNKKSFFLVAIIFFLSYIPFFLYYFPGNINTDNMGSFYQVTGLKAYSNFQPILYTLIFGGLWNLGKSIFGSSTAGIAIYTLFQMICTSVVFSTVLYYMAARKIDGKWRILTFLFLLLNPLNGWFTVRAEKGMLFHLSLILVIIGIADIIHNKGKFFEKKWKVVCFVLVSILMVFIRNNGIYTLLLTFPFLIIICKEIWKKVLTLVLLIFSIIFIIQGPIFNLLDISYSNPAEALSIPMQQYARISKYCGDRLTNKEKENIERYFNCGIEKLANDYTPWFADTVKWDFSVENFNNDKKTFIIQYIKFAFKYPVQTVTSIVFNTGNNFSPNFNVWGVVRNYGTETQEIYTTVGTGDRENFANFTSMYPFENKKIINFKYLDVLNTELVKIPIISDLIENIGFYFWLLILCFAYCVYAKQYKDIVMLLPILGLWVTTIAAPMVDIRYIYPMFLTIPLYIGIIAKNSKIMSEKK